MKNKVVVLYYHNVVANGEGNGYQKIDVDKFTEQMKFLSENGYNSIFIDDLDKPLPKKPVIVSFDDGFRNVYEVAAPIMREYNVKGNVYIATKYIEENDAKYMSFEMLNELVSTNQFCVSAHTHTHVDIRCLTEEDMRQEIELSNDIMARRLGVKPKGFCLPYGKYDKKSLSLLRKTGDYKFIFASYYGFVKPWKNKRTLARIGVSNNDSIEVFANKLKGKKNWKGPLQRLRLLIANFRGERITRYDVD